MSMMNEVLNPKKVKLVLENGQVFEGKSFGYESSTAGEIVFSTAMIGYPESLTDPTYAGQIMVATYPLIGNYGVPESAIENGLSKYFESEKIHVKALVVSDYSFQYSHWNAVRSLADWLKEEKVPAIYGVDTRELTKIIRENGVMKAKLEFENNPVDFINRDEINWVDQVSCNEVVTYGNGDKTVVVVDCGVKHSIIRSLTERNVKVVRVPWNYDFTTMQYDGLVISNGPGKPDLCTETIENIRKAMTEDKPILGLNMGNLLMAKAIGATTYKLKAGHRGSNQPVMMVDTNRSFISNQNTAYTVDSSSLPMDWKPLYVNLNDNTNEGFRHKTKPFFSANFSSESYIFDAFVEAIANGKINWLPKVEGLDIPKPKKVLILGSGALKIGEAGEFDYSGSQALKALKEEGIETVLINPNIATVQTSEGVADKIYFLPVTPYFVEKVIQKEQPDGLLLAFGGQTALNCGVKIFEAGLLEKYNVRVLGTPVQAIIDTEDRDLFVKKLDEINVKTIKSFAVDTIEDAHKAAEDLGYPVIIRAAYALGGLGSGFCNNPEELHVLAEKSLNYSPQLLVEKSLKGWKEIEFEVVRDKFGNCITVCNMENFDPLGIHTGESIVVAPCQTLTNSEISKLRSIAISIVQHVGIVGECNVQFAFDTQSEDYRVIEINARLSRSSALASKATGYPLAFVAAKIGLGYGLHELKNSVTKTTPAYFEPSIDYVVIKIPRWDLAKFHGVSREIGSSMKSVGEIMSIGRNFEETFQKGLRMIQQGMHGFVANKELFTDKLDEELASPTDKRVFYLSQALEQGYSVDRIYELTKIDKWFLYKLQHIIETSHELEKYNTREEIPTELFVHAKQIGFSDFQMARLVYKIKTPKDTIRTERERRGIRPVVKQIDTLAAEYPAQTNYLYLTYNGTEHDIEFYKDKQSVIVLGSGAYRIGSSVEFDWCSVNALNTIRKEGYRSVVINYNPETVSTDYDITDRLYFDELSYERVRDIIELEDPHGVIVSTGGQIPNNLALKLDQSNVKILGTQAVDIDNAEDRHKFSSMLDRIGVDQPRWKELTSLDEIHSFVDSVGFPVLVRPSYVLSGAAMNVCSNTEELVEFLKLAANVSQEHPVVVSEFIEKCKEIEFDAVAQNGEVVVYAISEHVEFAGVHSGDATIQFPPQKLYVETVRRIKKIAGKIAKELHISGPFNIQFLAKDNDIKVIECNLRASRSFPFVSKVLKLNFIELATKVMLGIPVEKPNRSEFDLDYVGIKASQFSFTRLQKADPVLGVDMASTGEVGCIGSNFDDALLTAMISVGYRVPEKNILVSSGDSRSKVELIDACKLLIKNGYNLFTTGGTHKFLTENGVDSVLVSWPDEEGNLKVMDMIANKEFDLVINIPKDLTKRELSNGYKIRRGAIDFSIPLITNARLASAFIKSFCKMNEEGIDIKTWSEYK
jgi:carbamoyl-phosphate synthase large subunit